MLKYPVYTDKMNLMSTDFLKLICKNNDSIGKPVKIDTPLGNIEGNNIKYIYHSMEMFNHLKNLSLNNVHIIEIGGGYGGLAYFINKLQKYYNINVSSYTIYDLKEVSELQKQYADFLNFDLITTQLGKGTKLKENSFLISNYGYSELNLSWKEKYIKEVFPYINHGFLSWNVVPFDIKLLKNIKFEQPIEIPYNEVWGLRDLRVWF